MKTFGEIAFTPAVQAAQEHYASRTAGKGVAPQGLSVVEAEFLAAADSFYLATVGETGWPYIQHRGGPRGFLKILSPTRIAFADFRGNRQYVSVGNVAKNDRASIIVVDYVNRRRLKLLGRLRFDDASAGADLADYPARVERIATFDIEAFDWNCPQHIRPRS
jgi:predicted pyridoxine 5'-phosphate oxidase superfamily flavin-nucleotide-binding protein